MRKLIYFGTLSLDGFIEDANRNLDWAHIDEELHHYINQRESEVGTYLYGRRMYELMNAYWPTADTPSNLPVEVEFSRLWKRTPKIVFSHTLQQVEGNATLEREDPLAFVARLKTQPGPPLEVGGAVLASSLIQAGLVDEYRLFFQPVILGAGTRPFPTLDAAAGLRLLETHTFQNGAIFLRYQRPTA